MAVSAESNLDVMEIAMKIIRDHGIKADSSISTGKRKYRKSKKKSETHSAISIVNDSSPVKKPETLSEFYESLSNDDKRKILDRQIELSESNAVNVDNVQYFMLECWKIAVKELIKKQEGSGSPLLKTDE